MRATKLKEISDTIFQLMLENKINSNIMNDITGRIDDHYQSDKCFVYLEIQNTKPLINMVFNSDNTIVVGRDLQHSAVCIQDASVSREHGCFFVENDYLYIQNRSHTQNIKIKRGLKKYNLGYQEIGWIMHSDKICIGNAVLKAYLFKGREWIIN